MDTYGGASPGSAGSGFSSASTIAVGISRAGGPSGHHVIVEGNEHGEQERDTDRDMEREGSSGLSPHESHGMLSEGSVFREVRDGGPKPGPP